VSFERQRGQGSALRPTAAAASIVAGRAAGARSATSGISTIVCKHSPTRNDDHGRE
jgi:hypothetical protein